MKISKQALNSFNRGDYSTDFSVRGQYTRREGIFLREVRYRLYGVLTPTKITQKDIKEYCLNYLFGEYR